MKWIVKFFKNHYWVLLLIVVFISYGQLLLMSPWQDDHTLFFKLQHLSEPAGYFGTGPIGVGPYKYIITPFIPIYYIFGLNPIYYYFLALATYFAATYVIFKVFSEVFNEKAGRVAGLLFAAGYISSDSFIRLFNSVVTSASVIFVSLFILFYWRFYKTERFKWYILAVILFFCATEFVRTRTHYLIALPIAFEMIFFLSASFKKNLFRSLFRLIPFVYIFYYYFVRVTDARAGGVKDFVLSLVHGDFSVSYGFLSSLTNLIVPDWISRSLVGSIDLRILKIGIIATVTILAYKLTKRKVAVLIIFLSSVWFWVSKTIFLSPLLNLGQRDFICPLIGGIILISSLGPLSLLKKDMRRLYLFFWLWILINLAAYSAYNPSLVHNSVHRYLTHSFLPFIGVLTIGAFAAFKKKQTVTMVVLIGIVVWGGGNLLNSFLYQRNIILTRSIPVKQFYDQLKTHLPRLQRGDIVYFDVAKDARGYFGDAFSVASMPEETAIAWRYGIDRYDIRRVIEFGSLTKLIREGSFTDKDKNIIPLNKIYTFFYSAGGLVDTTNDTEKLLLNGGKKEVVFNDTLKTKDELTVSLSRRIESVVPAELEITLKAVAQDPNKLDFPHTRNAQIAKNSVAKKDEYRRLAFAYAKAKDILFSKISVATNSDWKDDLAKNLIDQNPETFWRAHRILWLTQGAILTLDLKEVRQINRFVWVNVWSNSTPTEYDIQTSIDGINWQDAKKISSFKRIDTKDPEVVDFSSREARFVRMIITKTLNSDSPGIAEAWVVLTEFSKLDIKETGDFLTDPFGYVPSIESYKNTLSELGFLGAVQVYWRSNKSDSHETDANHVIKAVYDGVSRQYKIVLPAGGTEIDSLKLVGNQIPGDLTLKGITARPLSIKEVSK
ncbi:discoidin domain-containing protein [Patescibacteria group bacterium]